MTRRHPPAHAQHWEDRRGVCPENDWLVELAQSAHRELGEGRGQRLTASAGQFLGASVNGRWQINGGTRICINADAHRVHPTRTAGIPRATTPRKLEENALSEVQLAPDLSAAMSKEYSPPAQRRDLRAGIGAAVVLSNDGSLYSAVKPRRRNRAAGSSEVTPLIGVQQQSSRQSRQVR